MKIAKVAVAGSLESSDAMVTVEPRERGVTIEIESVVKAQFGREIERAAREVIAELGVDGAALRLNDRGAIECVLKARIETALMRAREVDA